ncbi:glycoside hydrolase [Phascolomyces articulosus]|uniref:Mannosyl-oligosaccharide glucosidase n=1 Tax=Phascolomyces articulosus TaxID=60185 RepID=A0AAD5K0N4_9FUNG|nr:glycoside hydrolase [Phascolomyces articulosus]
MWFDASHLQGFQRARHACDQGDGINGYGYHKHDGRRYGLQTINDGPSNIAITTEFVKVPGGDHGGDWGVRIHGVPMNDQVPSITSIIFYIGLEGEGSMDIVSKMSKKGLESPVRMEGDTPDLGDFEFQIVDGPLNDIPGPGIKQDLTRTQWWDIIMPKLVLSARERLMKETNQQAALDKPYAYFTLQNELSEDDDEIANLYAFQKVFKGEFQFDILFRSASSPKKITSELLGLELNRQRQGFETRFENTFHLEEKGFSSNEVEFAQYLLSNLLGGMGYFYGSAVVDRSHPPMQDEENFDGAAARPELTPPQSLFSATPSRPFFPRGFYWDEGFHQLVIGKWDNDLSLDIIKHWVSLIDDNGWIGREQILGDEARSKVPAEFQTQFPHYGNPPTLFLAITRYVQRLLNYHEEHQNDVPGQQPMMGSSTLTDEQLRVMHLENPTMARVWLESVYPKLKLNWQWFRTLQKGHIQRFGRQANNDEAYRWRGRTPEHCLTSGLDDYPRGEPPNIGELHADLLSWMAFATRMLKDISSHLGPDYADDVKEYTLIEQNMLENLDVLHWNEEHQVYCDQTVEEGEPVHVCHKGYVSLIPFGLGLIPVDSPKLGATLDMIENENELWTPYGLRSLSASDPKYRTGEAYWRGPIWMNINYLTLQSLYNNYIHVPGPYQEQAQRIYTNLRNNIIKNVYKDYRKTGYVWEQYDDETGQGVRSHPFTGWTSLVLLIMAEQYS